MWCAFDVDMNIVKSIVSSSGSLAKGIGSGTADLARTVGNGTVTVARSIGLKRGLIGLAAIGAVAGATVLLVRFLRTRGEDLADGADRTMARKPRANRHGKHQQVAQS